MFGDFDVRCDGCSISVRLDGVYRVCGACLVTLL